ncbi:Na+/H+ antiporter [Variovorax sp. GrIS 2.14]|jgi:Na+/H+ antiporter|uniref:Na+/H+ antiporter n=1 Tax=unclassified Variovorax TaxID=663243 RepID=UPI002B222A50|nr:Na+/H+ antiporter [Variovorax sp. RTB1]MEB0114490.1 Na+/H+ antiporter [Variovorax sp. RTB1]
MDATRLVLVLLLSVVVSRMLARVTRLPVPLVQIALGGGVFYAGLSSVALDPDVFFLVLLPPLLFLDGWRIPKDDLRREAPTILTLALGLVVFTVLGLGLLIHWFVPAMPLAVGFALAAIISPTDPIAVAAIAGQTPLPLRMRRILEGEALFNDASGLVCMRFAVAAALTGSFLLSQAVLDFLWVALGGLSIGCAVTWLLTKARSASSVLVGDDGGAQILVSVLIPFGVYLLAEAMHCSGILAAVAAGITMGHSPHSHWQAVTRIRRTAVWDTLQLVANGSVFVLLGEQIPAILAGAAQTVRITGHQNPWWLAVYVSGIVLALAALRFVWVWTSMQLAFLGMRSFKQVPRAAQWRVVAAMSVAGVRGAITLAGVLTLPLAMADGSPFPGRDLAILLAAGVIVVSLTVATVLLPRVLRGLTLPEPSHVAEEDLARSAAAGAAIRAIEAAQKAKSSSATSAGLSPDADLYAEAATRIVALYRQRMALRDIQGGAAPRRKDASAIDQQLRLAGLRAERDEIVRRGHSHAIDEATQGRLVREIDLEEARYSAQPTT